MQEVWSLVTGVGPWLTRFSSLLLLLLQDGPSSTWLQRHAPRLLLVMKWQNLQSVSQLAIRSVLWPAPTEALFARSSGLDLCGLGFGWAWARRLSSWSWLTWSSNG